MERYKFVICLLAIIFSCIALITYLVKKGIKDAKEYPQECFIYVLLGVTYTKEQIMDQVRYRNRIKGARIPRVYIYKVSKQGIISQEPIAKVPINEFNESML